MQCKSSQHLSGQFLNYNIEMQNDMYQIARLLAVAAGEEVLAGKLANHDSSAARRSPGASCRYRDPGQRWLPLCTCCTVCLGTMLRVAASTYARIACRELTCTTSKLVKGMPALERYTSKLECRRFHRAFTAEVKSKLGVASVRRDLAPQADVEWVPVGVYGAGHGDHYCRHRS